VPEKLREKLRIIYMGTPDFAAAPLQALLDHGHDIICVYSQPPRPKGRGQQVQLSPVHALAEENGIPVRTPLSLKKDRQAQEEFIALGADLAVVAAYGLILPKPVLEAPVYGCINIHASLLPAWRGASPIQHAIWAGDEESGICLMKMEEGLDTGPVYRRGIVKLHAATTASSLHDELSALGAAMLADLVRDIAEHGLPKAEPQDDENARYAPMLKKEDGRIDWGRPAAEIDRQIRALNPWPGTWTKLPDGRRLKILTAETIPEEFSASPGTVIDRIGHVSCGHDSGLRLLQVQPENGKKMTMLAAINGGHIKEDDILGLA
jgi:methionyl-tRNA formyltransferase